MKENLLTSCMGTVHSVLGRIEEQRVDVVVNSAHPTLLHGSGVCGAIHRAAGIELEAHCRTIGRCEVGELVSTPAFNLPATWIVHAVTPRLRPGTQPESSDLRLLDGLFREAFLEVHRLGARSVAIPALSMSGHRYPPKVIMPILVRACLSAARVVDLDVYFVSTDPDHVELFNLHAGIE